MAMFKTYASTPATYHDQSRDFQLIGHLYEAVFNSSKVAIDMIEHMIPSTDLDERLLNLATTTVGFIRKHEYNKKDLTMIISCFAYLLRIKGTKHAIEYAINVLLRSQGISDHYIIDINPTNKEVRIYLSTRLDDVVLLLDLFDYILPFGFEYRIYEAAIAPGRNVSTTAITDEVSIEFVHNQAIVNDTFNTTIEPVSTEVVVSPRPIANGTIVEEGVS